MSPSSFRTFLRTILVLALLFLSAPIVFVVVRGETLAQRQALFDFYGATNKGEGGWKTMCSDGGWRTMGSSAPSTFCNYASTPFSLYNGVTCNAQGGDIINLKLQQCNLVGTLTPSVSALTELRLLRLEMNQLNGTLPPQWSAMSALLQLSLQGNELSGTLPPQWSSMSRLQRLHLSSNTLNGTIPWQWFSMSELVQLDLSLNLLSGTLPPQWSAMTALVMLQFSSNQLNGTLPSEWSSMKRLQKLDLSSNIFSGTLPWQWSSMTELELLYLQRNSLVGTLPPQWSSMNKLWEIYLLQNQLTGTLPSQWSNMTSLLELDFSLNELSGTLPPDWSAMTKLRGLHLYVNRLSGTLPPQWSAMSELEQLGLELNQLSGTVPFEWQEGMKNIALSIYATCGVTCSGGLLGINTNCTDIGPYDCLPMRWWYNCLNVSTTALPPVNNSNPWNWNSANMYFGPQRTDCTNTATPMIGVLPPDTTTPTMSFTARSTFTAATAEETVTMDSASFSQADRSRSVSMTESLRSTATETAHIVVPRQLSLASRGRPLAAWEGSVSTVGAMVGSLVAGAAAAGGSSQRAALQRSLSSCGEGDGEPLDIASSPLQLGFGPEAGHYVRGAVVFNVALLAAMGCLGGLLLCAVFAWRRETVAVAGGTRRGLLWSFHDAAASLQLPGLLHVPVMFLLQPVVSSSVWCLQSTHMNGGGDVAVGLMGLILSIGYTSWAMWVVSLGRAHHHVVGIIPPPSAPSLNRSETFGLLELLRRVLLGVQEEQPTEWVERRNRHGTFVQRHGTILCAYRAGRQWFLIVELLSALLLGVIGGVALAFPEVCGGPVLTSAFLCLLLAALSVTLWAQPYNEPLDHVVLVVGHLLSIAWALCSLADAEPAILDALSAAETWLSVAALLALVVGVVASKRLRTWLARRLRLIPTAFAEAEQEREQRRVALLKEMLQDICHAQRQRVSAIHAPPRHARRSDSRPPIPIQRPGPLRNNGDEEEKEEGAINSRRSIFGPPRPPSHLRGVPQLPSKYSATPPTSPLLTALQSLISDICRRQQKAAGASPHRASSPADRPRGTEKGSRSPLRYVGV